MLLVREGVAILGGSVGISGSLSSSACTSRRGLSTLAALIICGAALALLASPAGAIIYRVSKNHYISYAGILGKPTPSNVHPSRPARSSNFDSINTNLDYSGGPVMPSSTNYVDEWRPSTFPYAYESGNFCGSRDSGGNLPACGAYVSGVTQFFSDMAAASGTTTNSDSVSTQYNDAVGGTHWSGGTGPGHYQASYGGLLVDTDPYPASGCPGAPNVSGGICLTDAQIQAELQTFLSAHSEPAGLTNEYYVLTPPGVASCFAQNSDGSWDCSGNAGGTGKQVFCAYHGMTATASHYLYSNIADLVNVTGCDPFATGACDPNTGFTCFYNSSWADAVLSAISHEHNESLTDPKPNNAWTDYGNQASQTGGEIGDKCNNDGLDDPNAQIDHPGGNDNFGEWTPYNEVINNRYYLIQQEWSNDGTRCLDHWSPSGAIPGASFIVSSQSGRTVSFNATGSCGNVSVIASCSLQEYVWQFNDNTAAGQPPQNGTIETSATSITHTFPGPGTYTVALTTMTAVGFSHGTEATVHIYATPTAHISASGSGLAGSAISFSSGGTTHDPALSITSYAWHFGDGASGTGPNPAHLYSHAGAFGVSLTVTDSKGQTASTSGTVTISASCRIPNVKGKKLSVAQSTIRGAGCAVGSVHKPHKKRRHKKLVVKTQTPGPGGLVRAGTRVNLTLVYH
jgi:hypothetical protein